MKIDLKTATPYIVMVVGFAMAWGMLKSRLEAVESKIDTVTQMQLDIAVIKEKIVQMDDRMAWIEEFLIKNYKEY
tara:strand:+ start:217 stop:441 length:225 start_codon:yes stop_codon:yes gene_type:complete